MAATTTGAPEPFAPITFTNTRFPEEKIFLARRQADGSLEPTMGVLEFYATKALARTPLEAENVRRACPYAIEEPVGGDQKPFTHKKSGFWTYHQELYDAFVASYEENRR